MSDLVQIKIPPLRQSTQEMMACPKFYTTVMIEGNQPPSGLDSARGTEIHRTMAAYLSHCAANGVSVDLEAFDRFSRGAGPQASRILAGLRDGFEVDHAHLFSTELALALSEHFEPTDLAPEMVGIVVDAELPAHYQGTIDGIYLFPEQAQLRIDDFKSHARPFDPDDKPQGKEYAAFAFKHFSWAKSVTFRLVFVRYRNVVREVTYTRDELPALIEALRMARERQKKIHEDHEAGREIMAIAGPHCWYCPLLTNAQCPIAKYNPNMQLTMAQRLNFNLWYSQFSRANNAAMRAFTQETGKNIILRDYNGKHYIFGPVAKEAEVYPVFSFTADGLERVEATGQPVLPIIELLDSYADSTPDDVDWMKHIMISSTSLKKYLKTKKRAMLDQAVDDTSIKITKTSLRVSKPLDAVPEEEPDEDEWEEEEEF